MYLLQGAFKSWIHAELVANGPRLMMPSFCAHAAAHMQHTASVVGNYSDESHNDSHCHSQQGHDSTRLIVSMTTKTTSLIFPDYQVQPSNMMPTSLLTTPG